jgi:heme exporter protein D
LAEIDRQKEKVVFWRMLFFFWLTVTVGLVAFIFNNFDKLSDVKLLLSNITLLLVIVFLIITSIKMKKETDKLRDL